MNSKKKGRNIKEKLKTIINSLFDFSKKRLLIGIVLSIAFIIAYWNIYNISIKATDKETDRGIQTGEKVDSNFSNGNVFRQSFWIHERCKLNKVKIQMSTNSDTITVPTIYFAICDKFGKVYCESTISTSMIAEGAQMPVDTQGVELDGKNRYYIVLSADTPNGSEDITPNVYTCTPNDVNDILYVYDVSQKNKVMDVTYEYTTIPFGITDILVFVIAAICIILSVTLLNKYLKWKLVILLSPIICMLWIGLWKCNSAANSNLINPVVSQIVSTICIVLIAIFIIKKKSILSFVEKSQIIAKYHETDIYKKYSKLCADERKSKRTKNIISLIALAILFILQVFIASRLYQKIGWDVTYVYDTAKNLYTEGNVGSSNISYFQLFPNNKGILIIMYAALKILGKGGDKLVFWGLVVFNIILVDLAIVLAYQIAKEIFNKQVAIISSILIVVLLGLSGWIVVPYTDTMSVWAPLFIVWLYLKFKKCDNIKQRMILLGLIGMMTIFGYHIKPQCAIVMIAIVIVELILIIIKRNWVSLRGIVFWLIGAAIGVGCFTMMCGFIPPDENVSDYSVPAVHFIMMGSAENPYAVSVGGFNYDDTLSYTYKFNTTEEKSEACTKRLISYLKNYGVAGYLAHVWDKAEWILGDGSFAWQIEGGFYQDDYSSDKAGAVQTFLREQYYGSIGGYDNTQKLNHFGVITGIWLVVLLLFIVPFGKTDHIDKKIILYLATIGCIAFTLIFEGRARYLINYIPFFCIIASASLSTLLMIGTKDK